MIVVGDASALIALHRIDGWPVLPGLYGEVHVPESVWREVFAAAPFAVTMPPPPPWLIRHENPARTAVVPGLDQLDAGEADAIRLARSLPAELLLIDEMRGRAVAQRLGLRITGVVGLLIEARRRDLIPSLAVALAGLREHNFWLSESLIREALRLVGEKEIEPRSS